jgi:hypothetical protein
MQNEGDHLPVELLDSLVGIALVLECDEAETLGLASVAVLGDEAVRYAAILLKCLAQGLAVCLSEGSAMTRTETSVLRYKPSVKPRGQAEIRDERQKRHDNARLSEHTTLQRIRRSPNGKTQLLDPPLTFQLIFPT